MQILLSTNSSSVTFVTNTQNTEKVLLFVVCFDSLYGYLKCL